MGVLFHCPLNSRQSLNFSAKLELIPVVLGIAKTLPETDFERKFVPVLLMLLQHNDKAIRGITLENFGAISEKLSARIINDRLYGVLTPGFSDAIPAMREVTMRVACGLADRLKANTVNTDLIRYLGRLQTDDIPGIRANAMIAVGRLSRYLDESVRAKILAPAFTRALQDPFKASRSAALLALSGTTLFCAIVLECSFMWEDACLYKCSSMYLGKTC